MTEREQDQPAILDLVLRPHRSLSPAGFWAIMAGVGGFSFVAGSVFWWVGAWPVVGFLGLEVVLVYVAFKASYAGGRAYERVRLSERALTVERRNTRGRCEAFTLQPYWLRVQCGQHPTHQGSVVLSSHGRSLAIGTFLSPDERAALAAALEAGLAQLRQAAFARSQAEDIAHPVEARRPAAGP